jgi:plastocyanin
MAWPRVERDRSGRRGSAHLAGPAAMRAKGWAPCWARGCAALRAAAGAAVLALVWAAPAAATPVQVAVSDAAGKPLAGAVVFAESAEARAAVKPLTGIQVVQRAKQFAPQLTVVTVGTAVHFPNEDTVRHHVYSFSPVKKFELKLYAGTPSLPVVFDKPGVAVLGCNIHDQMAAWVLILETPHFARSDSAGNATLDLPAGEHRLRAWHPELPPGAPATDQPLKVAASPVRASVRVAAP